MNQEEKFFFSPSSYLRFLSCNQSVALRTVHRDIKVKTPQKALLGQIAHKVLEIASKSSHKIEQTKWNDWFEKTWSEIESDYFKKYKIDWEPNPVAPIVSWKSYFKTKIAAKGLVGSRLETKFKNSEYALDVDGDVQVYSEKFLSEQNLRLNGYIDRLIVFPDHALIYDYKFGQSSLDSHEYKIQMGIYSILTTRNFSVKVQKASIIAGVGNEYVFNFNDNYLSDLEKDLVRALEVIDGGASVASPSLKHCKFCSFKPVCKDFNESGMTAENGIPLAVKGRVTMIKGLTKEYVAIVLEDTSKTPAQSYEVSKVPVGHQVEIGDLIHLSGPMQFFSQTSIEFKPNTILWRL